MDLNRIINMIVRMVMRKAINTGINKGMQMAAGKGKAPKDMTPEEVEQANAARDIAKRARKAARITRRLGR